MLIFDLLMGRLLRPSLAATADRTGVFRFPSMRACSCPQRRPLRAYKRKAIRKGPNFFFVQVPPLHAALWQRRSEPVKGLRCAAMNAHKTRALDRTRLAPARRLQDMKRGHSNKEIWFEADALLQNPPHAGSTGERTSCLTPAAHSHHHRAAQQKCGAPQPSESPYQQRTTQRDNPTQQLIKQAVDFLHPAA